MSDDWLAAEIARLVSRWAESREGAPEMSGLSLAFDRGNVSLEEYEAAEKVWAELAVEHERMDAQLAAWERDASGAFQRFLAALRDRVAARGEFPAVHAPGVLRTLDHRLGRTTEAAHDLKWALWIALRECGSP